MKRLTKITWIVLFMISSSIVLFILDAMQIIHISAWLIFAPIWMPLVPWVFVVAMLWFYGRKES